MLATRISRGLDAAGHPSGAALKAAGIGVQLIYLTGAFAVTRSILADYKAHGIWCAALYEVEPDAASQGIGRGKTDMGSAIKGALDLGIPHGAAIVLCDDTDAIAYPTVEAYWRGGLTSAHISGFKAGGYGPHSYCTRALTSGAIDVAMVAGAWEDGTPQKGIAVKQTTAQTSVGGVDCDIDQILLPRAPGLLWNLDGLYVQPAPSPSEDDNVTTHQVTVVVKKGHRSGSVLSGVAYPSPETKITGSALLMGGGIAATHHLANSGGKVWVNVELPSEADSDVTAKVNFSIAG